VRIAIVDRVDPQNGVRGEPAVITRVGEQQWQHAEVDEVLRVDSRVGLGDHGTEAEEGGYQRSVFAAGTRRWPPA